MRIAHAGRANPSRGIWVLCEVKQPLKKSQAVSSPKSKPEGVRAQTLSECRGIVIDIPDRIGDDLSNSGRVLILREQISGNTGWHRYG